MQPRLLQLTAPLISTLVFASLFSAAAAHADGEGAAVVPPEATTPTASPAVSPTTNPDTAPISSSDPRVHYALGARVRGLFVPGFLLSTVLDQAQPLNSYALGLEFTRRQGPLDVVLSLDYGNYTTPDGNWLGGGKNAVEDTHFLQVRGLGMVSADVSWIWNHDLASWLALMIGGGVGVGVVVGDVYEINASSTVCAAANAGDATKCFPVVNAKNYSGLPSASPTYIDAGGKVQPINGALLPSDPDYQRKLDGLVRAQAACVAANGFDCKDTAEHPYYHALTDKPPVMVVVNFVIGFKIKIQRHFNFNVSGGFRDGFFFGGGPEAVF